MTDVLMNQIIRKLLGPTLIVDQERTVQFASESLCTILGRKEIIGTCEGMLFAPRISSGGGCCWDSIDDYLKCGGDALWPMRRDDGTWISMLCQLSVIDIAGDHGMVHIRLRPLKYPLHRDVELFRTVLASFPQVESYMQWARLFFARHGKLDLEWLDPHAVDDPRLGMVQNGIAVVGGDAPFDIRVLDGNRRTVRRVVAAEGPEGMRIALLRSDTGRLRAGELASAWAAVSVATQTRAHSLAAPTVAPMIFAELTPREREILGLVLEGLTDSEMATRLGVSEHTVKNHVRHIMDKSGVRRRMQLAALARVSA